MRFHLNRCCVFGYGKIEDNAAENVNLKLGGELPVFYGYEKLNDGNYTFCSGYDSADERDEEFVDGCLYCMTYYKGDDKPYGVFEGRKAERERDLKKQEYATCLGYATIVNREMINLSNPEQS